jgi:hypothetical protein
MVLLGDVGGSIRRRPACGVVAVGKHLEIP